MSDDFGQDSSGGVRRVSSRDRKRRIEPRNLSFPPDDLPIDETQPPAAPAHDDTQGLPSTPHPQPLSHASGDRGFQREAKAAKKQGNESRQREKAVQAPRARRRFGWRDAVALLFALLSCGAIGYFAYIWQNPYSVLNPLSPPLLPPAVVSETPLPTATPTASATPTARPSATFTPLPVEAIGTNAPVAATLGTPDLTLTLLAGTPRATPL
jgi:hypothetical protein